MFRKLLSTVALMFVACCITAGAQEVKTTNINLNDVRPSYSNAPVTSQIQLADEEKWWSYFDGQYTGELRLMGLGENTEIPMLYSAAICIPAGLPAAQGQTITGLSFTFLDSKNIGDVKVWISEGLPNFAEEATICCQNVTTVTGRQNANDSVNEVRFDTPYIVDTNKDVYVGYSFEVKANEGKADQYPVVVKGKKTDKGALYLRFGYADEWWYDYSSPQYDQYEFGNLAMSVLFKGTTEAHAVSIDNTFADITAGKNSEVSVPLNITNLGKKEVTSLGLIVDVAGTKQEVTVTPEQPVDKNYSFNLVLNTPEEIGQIPVTITVDKVNGQPNSSQFNKCTGNLVVLSRIVPHRVVIEEFTGFWCGWCPKGIVAMEKAKQVYGDNVIVITVHYNDALACKDYAAIANQTVASYPQAHVDRTIMSVDPYYGSSLYECFGISKDIDARAAEIPVAEVIADAEIDGDIITAKSDVRFLYTGEAHYAVAFVLTENAMESDNWEQANNLIQWKGQPIEEMEPMFEEWINGTPKMSGIVFNDVAIGAQGLDRGISGSIPSYVVAEESNVYETEFNCRDYKKIMDNDELNLCVLLFNTDTGHIVNSAFKSLNPKDTGIEDMTADNGDAVEVARYTVDGSRINAPQKGVNIVKYSDGKIKKVIVK